MTASNGLILTPACGKDGYSLSRTPFSRPFWPGGEGAVRALRRGSPQGYRHRLHARSTAPAMCRCTRALKELGYTQSDAGGGAATCPDGHFPTCPYPNPEIREALALGIAAMPARCGADLLLATDPDCDRVGVAVRDPSGGYCAAHRQRNGHAAPGLPLRPTHEAWQNARRPGDDQDHRDHGHGRAPSPAHYGVETHQCAHRLQVHRRADRPPGSAGPPGQLRVWL